MKNVILSDEQRSVLRTLLNFTSINMDDKTIAFTAPAGCGKTTVITKFIEELNPMLNICICAPTNKALNILNKNKVSNKADYKTIYSLLGLVPINNKDTKKITKKGKFKLADYDVVVIDESSMLSTIVLDFIHAALDEIQDKSGKSVKIIYVGDSFQLPPVNEKNSPALKIDNKCSLTKVMRSEDMVLSLCTQIREYIESGFVPNYGHFSNSIDVNGNGVRIVSKQDFINGIVQDFTKPIIDRDSIRIVSYTNHSIDNYNAIIREANGLDRFVRYYPTELILAKEPITTLMTLENYHISDAFPPESDTILFPIATEFKITDVELGESMDWKECHSKELGFEMYPFTIHTYKLTCVSLDSDSDVVTFKIPQDFDYYNRIKNDLVTQIKQSLFNGNSNRTLWDVFYRLRDFVATPQSVFALTSHGSQGNSFDKVYVDAGNILSMCKYDKDTALRSLYVAVSRARKNVILTF